MNRAPNDFYVSALGFVYGPRSVGVLKRTRDAGGTTEGLQWCNIGLQQIHLPSDEPQRVNGYIGLQYPNLLEMKNRISSVGIAMKEVLGANGILDHLEVSCPIGNRFRLFELNSLGNMCKRGKEQEQEEQEEQVDVSNWLGPVPRIAPDPSYEYALPGGKSIGMGMSHITIYTAIGSAGKICAFYNHYFRSSAYTSIDPNLHTACCVVPMGHGQFLRYTEKSPKTPYLNRNIHNSSSSSSNSSANHTGGGKASAELNESGSVDGQIIDTIVPHSLVEQLESNYDDYAYDGHHIAVYVHDFADLYTRLAASNLHWDNPRFPQFSYRTLSDALRHQEFRVKDIVDTDTNQTILELEHEIR